MNNSIKNRELESFVNRQDCMKSSLSIYIHIPFCVQKCAYCDFLSAPATLEVQEQYLHMLMQEIRQKAMEYAADHIVKTIFIGGGTPTCVSADLLCEMLSVVRECFEVKPEAEISMECNPGTVDEEKFKKYRAAGINRLSIGLQSTQDDLLQKLGRIHSYEQFLETYQAARSAGFSNINIDLMSALPGQTLPDYEETLHKVLALKPEHISAYSLIIEEGTPFYDMDLDLPDEDTERLMYERTETILQEQGYERYEISNYALPGKECRHNQVYWERGEYLGVGLGASSLLRKMENKELPYAAEIRTKNNSDLNSYLQGDFSSEEEIALTRREAMEEFFFLGLRQMKGVSLIQFAEEFGEDTIEWFNEAIGRSLREGLLIQEGGRLYLSKKGIDVSNTVFARFLE